MPTREITVRLLCVLLFSLTTFAFAQPPQESNYSLSLGFGVAASMDAYRDADDDVWPIPLVDLRYHRFTFRGISAGFDLYRSQRLNLSLTAAPEFGGVEAEDGDYFLGLEDRNISAMAGLALNYNFNPKTGLDFSWKSDVTGEHDGNVAEMNVTRRMFWGRTIFFPSIGLEYRSDDMMDYYYGVSLAEARADRPAYVSDAGLNFKVGFLYSTPISEKMSFQALVNLTRLSDEASDSPLIEDDIDSFAFLGIAWKLR